MRKSINNCIHDDVTMQQMLTQIARKHLKLALEHSELQTTKQRREAIRNEIIALRIECDIILS